MTKQEIGILLCAMPFALFSFLAYICAWYEAVEDCKYLNNNEGIIVMSIFTFFIASISFGFYLLFSK